MSKEYIIIGIIILAIILIVITILAKSKNKNLSEVETSAIVTALGGSKNIVSFEAKVSRLNVYIEDTSLVNIEEIRNITKCGVSLVNNKVQVILKDNVDVMNKLLSDLKMRD
ncbi:MAG: PTS transporter subunit EIIB [Bacilli bacterium]